MNKGPSIEGCIYFKVKFVSEAKKSDLKGSRNKWNASEDPELVYLFNVWRKWSSDPATMDVSSAYGMSELVLVWKFVNLLNRLLFFMIDNRFSSESNRES